MRRLVLALLLLVLPATAAARGFTPAEMTEVREAYDASHQFIVAFEQLATAITLATGDTARTDLGLVWFSLNSGLLRSARGSFFLIGVNAADQAAPQVAMEAQPRSAWVTEAWSYHDLAKLNATGASDAIDVALGHGGQVAGYYTALTAAKTAMTAASAALNGINRSLPYAEARNLPFCNDAARATRYRNDTMYGACNVYGPHGTWPDATHHLWLGFQSFNDVLESWKDVYVNLLHDVGLEESFMSDSTNPAIANMLTSVIKLMENNLIVLFNWAAIPVTPTQCGFTPFNLIARSIERLVQFGDTTSSTTPPAEGGPLAGNPFYYVLRDQMASNLDTLSSQLPTRPNTHLRLDQGFHALMQGWRWTSGGFWRGFELPSDLVNHIQASGFPSGTTTFPYSYGVTNTADLRVYVRTVGASSERDPLVEGVDYTVTPNANPESGGTITLSVAPADGKHIMIERVNRTRLEEQRRQPYPANDPTQGTVGPCS